MMGLILGWSVARRCGVGGEEIIWLRGLGESRGVSEIMVISF